MITARTHTTTKMSVTVLNSGMVGLGDGDSVGEIVRVGVDEAVALDVLIIVIELPSKFVT
jgi:hypothetical protein